MSPRDLKDFPLLAELSDEDREALAELLEEGSLPAGRRVFSEGTEAEGLVLLARGTLLLRSRRTGLSETVEAGAALGAVSLVCVGPRESTAVAQTECELLRLSRPSFWRLAGDHPSSAFRLTEAILKQFAGLIRQGLDKLAE